MLHVSIFSLTELFSSYFTFIDNIVQTCLSSACAHLIARFQYAIVHIILLLGIVLRLHFYTKVSIVLYDAGIFMYMKMDICC
jgi:hypothetical protein